jgi:hypothetical protein
MQERAVRLREIAVARDTLKLAPGRASRDRSNPAPDRTAAVYQQCISVLG